MLQTPAKIGVAAILLLTAACSQDPAQIVMKGQNTYGRNGGGSYAMASVPLYSYSGPATASGTPAQGYTTASGNATQNAGIQPVGVHELASLSPAAGQPTFNSTVKAPSSSSTFAMASPSPSPVNQWTNQPHFSQADNAPVSELDSIVGNDGSNKKPHAAKTDMAFMWPVSSKHILSGFGPKGDGKVNDGINIAAGDGEPVWASADGEVVYVGNALQGYGNMILIKHAGDKTTAYAHLSRAVVDKYERVKQGDIIGYVGTTGNVKEPQLHFAIREGSAPVDPAKYLARSVAAAN